MKQYDLEKKIYECLGVRFFRMLVFKLEKMVHYRDKGTNINYHIAKYEPSALEDFVKYLFYNGAIHVRNIAFFVVYVILRAVFGRSIGWYDIALLILAVKDAYCVMLQRYNYIRLYERRCRLEQRRKSRMERAVREIRNGFHEHYECTHAAEDLAVIRSMKQRLRNGETVVIREYEQKAIDRIMDALQNSKEEN